MSAGFPLVALRSIACPVSRPVPVLSGTSYRTFGVKWWGEGAYERETIDGSATAAKTLFLIHEGDLVINKIWVRHGSVAIATRAVHGCAASNEFPAFELDRTRVEPKWLHWLTKTRYFWNKCADLSFGTSGKNRIKPEQFLTVEIPLPPLAEQRRIVARIEEVAGKIEAARGLREFSARDVIHLWNARLRAVFRADPTCSMQLHEVCEAIIDNLHTTPRYVEDGVRCVRSQDISWGSINYETMLKTSEEEFAQRSRRVEPQLGDIVYVREGDVGRCAVVDGSHRFSLGQRVMMIRPDCQKIDPSFLLFQLLSPPVVEEQVRSGKTGTTSHHVNVRKIRDLCVAVPPLPEQRHIVAHLDALQTKVDALKRLQAETAAELEALLPSVLDRAFSGGL